MNMKLFLWIVGTALFFAGIRWLYRHYQAGKTVASVEASQQRLHRRRAKDSGLSHPPSEPLIHSMETKKVPPLLLPGKGRRSDYHRNWPDGFWSPTIPSIIPDCPARFPGVAKSHVIKSTFPPVTDEIRPRFD